MATSPQFRYIEIGKPFATAGAMVRPWGGVANVTSPFTVRIDAWAKKTAGEFDYTESPAAGRYHHGTADGGIVFLPPETDMLLVDNDFTVSGSTLSTPLIAVAGAVRWAAGTPDEATGGIRDGFDWGLAGTGLLFRARDGSANTTDAFRLTAGGLVAFKAATDFWGTFEHAITADRTWTFPDKSGTVALVGGAIYAPITTKTANYTATADDHTILCDATAASFTITLPAAASVTGLILVIKKIAPAAAANTVTIDANGAETIDDAATQVIAKRYDSLTIQSDGTEWWII